MSSETVLANKRKREQQRRQTEGAQTLEEYLDNCDEQTRASWERVHSLPGRGALTIREIAKRVGLSKSYVHRLLKIKVRS